MRNRLLLIVLLIPCFYIHAQLRVGDPGVEINTSIFDADYPQMERWANAGVTGGIPFTDSFDKTATIDPCSSTGLNNAITSMATSLAAGEKGLITLKNGRYTIDATVKMQSNVSLIGESREDVQCWLTMYGGNSFSFYKVSNCGIYNLTIEGSWGKPFYDWNISSDLNRETLNENVSVKISTSTDCWLDKVTILNAADSPMRCPGNHCTFRDLIVDGCHRKAGGAEGYFFIQGSDNLVTGCKITHLRHISLQGSNVRYNVVYNNDFHQEVSFHSGDDGNNLIENNRITLPADMPPGGAYGGPDYCAIMGPWSTQHTLSAHPNYLYKNTCLELNYAGQTHTPWSDNNIVYYGPHVIRPIGHDNRHNNFTAYDKGVPQGGTLYAIKLGDPNSDTSIEDEKMNAQVYPVPFTTQLNVVINNKEVVEISLVDIKGKIISSNNKVAGLSQVLITKGLNELPKGIYFLQLQSGKRVEVIKVMKG